MTTTNEKTPVANPDDATFYGRLFRVSAGAYGSIRCLVYADSLDSALDEFMDWAADNARGLYTEFSDADYREAAAELGLVWAEGITSDIDVDRIVGAAEVDHTMVGHTTYAWQTGLIGIPSWEWSVCEVDAPGR